MLMRDRGRTPGKRDYDVHSEVMTERTSANVVTDSVPRTENRKLKTANAVPKARVANRALRARYECYPPNTPLPALQPARYLDSQQSLHRRSSPARNSIVHPG